MRPIIGSSEYLIVGFSVFLNDSDDIFILHLVHMKNAGKSLCDVAYSRRNLVETLNAMDYYDQQHSLELCPQLVNIRGVHFYSSLVEKALLRLL